MTTGDSKTYWSLRLNIEEVDSQALQYQNDDVYQVELPTERIDANRIYVLVEYTRE